MGEVTYIMKGCPDCKTYSITSNDICLNCGSRWIFKTVHRLNMKGSFFLLCLWIGFVILAATLLTNFKIIL